MAIRSKRDPQSEYDRNSNRAEASGWVLLAGLAVELVFAFVLDKPALERYSTIAEDVLIVGGVWGEIHFGRRARVAGDRLQADATARISEAEARWKVADQKAADAQLELARFRARREMSKQQRDDAAGRLKQYAGTHYDFGAQSNDPEIMFCILDINAMLEAAGWVAIPWMNPAGQSIKRWITMPPIGLGLPVLGILIGIKIGFVWPAAARQIVSELLPAARALAGELAEISGMERTTTVPYAADINPEASINEHAVHILVGRKT